jgi:hypothetical protein
VSTCCCDPRRPRRGAHADPLGARFAPLEVNNGGSQGHWICSSVNDVLLAALGPRGQAGVRQSARADRRRVRGFNRWLKERVGARRFRALFPGGHVPLAFVSGPYSGRLVNDVEGPRIADFIAQRYKVAAGYFIALDELEVCDSVRIDGREMHFVRRRDGAPGERFAVWSDLYVTESMPYFEAVLAGHDPRTRTLAEAVCGATCSASAHGPAASCLRTTGAPGREGARGRRLGGDGTVRGRRRAAAGRRAGRVRAHRRAGDAVIEAQQRWVLKGRFGCGGNAVIVGAHPSWPTQRLPAVEVDADGRTHVERHAIANLAATPASRSSSTRKAASRTPSWHAPVAASGLRLCRALAPATTSRRRASSPEAVPRDDLGRAQDRRGSPPHTDFRGGVLRSGLGATAGRRVPASGAHVARRAARPHAAQPNYHHAQRAPMPSDVRGRVRERHVSRARVDKRTRPRRF